MKQTLVPNLKLSLKQSFHQAKAQSLKILTCSSEELRIYLHEQMSRNPFLHCSYGSSHGNHTDMDMLLEYSHEHKSLYDEIMEQARFSKYRPDPKICEYLLYQLDSNGYFKISRRRLFEEGHYPKDILKRHIAILRTFEPYGIFAFDVKDCLKIQIRRSQYHAKETALLICDYLEELALHHYDVIKNNTGLCDEDIEESYSFIKTLNPKPASGYSSDTVYIHPEFIICVEDENIKIREINDDLHISFHASKEEDSKELRDYMKQQKAQVNNIINSIQKRSFTLMQIMQYICDIQKDFFLHHGNLHHLTMAMIAENCGLHVSTVSRALTNKSFEFENRYYLMKNMLSSGGVDDIGIEEIKMEIRGIIDGEDKKKPLSDDKICEILNERGIAVSRRTVAKYRESCHIFNSQKRRIK